MQTFGSRLKALRKENGYTLEMLGEKLNTTKVTVSRYEHDVRVPKNDTLRQLSKMFNVSIDYLCCNTNQRISLDSDDKKDVLDSLEEIKMDLLENSEAALFNGEPMSQEAIDSLLTAMEIGLSLAKQKQKQRENQ